MKNASRLFQFNLGCLFVLSASFCIPHSWNTEVSDIRQVEVHSRVYTVNEDGEDYQVLEYFCESQFDTNFELIINRIQQAEYHGSFIKDAEVSKRLNTVSATEWVNYYQFEAPWPMPDSDSVTHYWLKSSNAGQEIEITGKTIPTDYPLQGLRRMERNEVVYRITNLGDGKVGIYTYGKTTPVMWAPDWLVESWFPDGPAEILLGISELGKE